MNLISKILSEGTNINIPSKVIKAVVDWVEMSGDEKLHSKVSNILSKITFPDYLKADNRVLYRVVSFNREKFKK